jgi:D5 N terminal like
MDAGHQVVFELFGTREVNGRRIREWRARSGPLASTLMGGRYSLGADYRGPDGEPIEIPPMPSAADFERATERELGLKPLPDGSTDFDKAALEWRRRRDRDERRKGNGGEPIKADAHAPTFSEESLALLFAKRHAGDLRYVAEWGKWLSWTGTHWRFDDTLHAFNVARQIAREAAATCEKPGEAKMIASSKTAYAIERLAKADRRLAATIDQWDADRWLLNTLIGVVDLRSGRSRPHRPDDYMTKITAVGPSGDCPGFLVFLNKIMGGDEALIAYLQRVFGYCLTGDTSEQAMFFNYGGGQNGKTVLMLRDANRDVHREQDRETSDGACTSLRRQTRHSYRDGGGTALGGKPPQGSDRRRASASALYAQELFRVPADIETLHFRQP